MKASRSDWYIPRDWLFFFGLQALPLIALILTGFLLWFVLGTRQGDPTFVWIALVLAATGIILLFIARLPLYRQGRYFTFGSKALPVGYRKVYQVAYYFIGASVVILLVLLAVLR